MAIWSKEMKPVYQRNIYLFAFIAALFTDQRKALNQPSVHVQVGRETEEYDHNETLNHLKSKFYYLRLEIILNKPDTKGQVPHDFTYMRNSKPFNLQ